MRRVSRDDRGEPDDAWRVPPPEGHAAAPERRGPGALGRQVAELLGRLSAPERSGGTGGGAAGSGHESAEDYWPDETSGRRGGRARQLAALTAALAQSAREAGARAVAGGRWLTELVEQAAPAVTIRDLDALRAAYGCEGDALAEALTRSAARTTAGIGAAAGALAGAEFVAPPALLAAPVQLAAETLVVVAVELRLIGELHEVYGVALPEQARERAAVLLGTWVRRRALEPGAGSLFLGAAARRELRKRLLKRIGESASSLAPFLAGAVAGAEINRRETKKLGEHLSGDLRDRALWAFPADRVVAPGETRRRWRLPA